MQKVCKNGRLLLEWTVTFTWGRKATEYFQGIFSQLNVL